jgi:hypothetical protein
VPELDSISGAGERVKKPVMRSRKNDAKYGCRLCARNKIQRTSLIR